MPYRLVYDQAVIKDLRRIDRQDQRFILETLDRFADDYSQAYETELLRTGKLKKLRGEWRGFYRLRLRTYRVIYRKYTKELLVFVVRIGHRRDVYD